MAEYINRELLLKRFCEKCNEAMEDEPCEPAECFAREIIKSLPKADVAEVRRGEWVFKRRYYDADECNCSECGQLKCIVNINSAPLEKKLQSAAWLNQHGFKTTIFGGTQPQREDV